MKKVYKQIALGAVLLPSLQMVAQNRPNIVLIMTDQQSYNTISALADCNQGTYSKTPNIDRLVKNGISFTRTYCSNPVSVPSRFALFTGKYGGQYAVRENNTPTADETEVCAMLATNGMGGVFERGGYDTYYGGKVHLPFSGNSGQGKFAAPTGYGFVNCFTKDEREGLGAETAKILDGKGNDLKNGKKGKPFLLVASFLNPHDICIESASNLSSTLKGENDNSEKTRLKTACIRALRNRLNEIDSTKFYSKMAPALPFNLDKTKDFPELRKSRYEDFPDYYWRKYRWTYAQLVSLVDDHIGKILDALDRNPELKKNTVVVFTSDHGEMQGAHDMSTKNINYDECQRVPFIFCGTGIKPGARDNSLVCNGVDLMPTLCEIAGIKAPAHDGVSIASHLDGNSKKELRKMLFTEGDGFLSVLDDHYKYTYFDNLTSQKGEEMLVNLHSDKGELVNIIEGNEKRAAEMKAFIPFGKVKAMSQKMKKGKKGAKTGESKMNKSDKKQAKKAARKAAKKKNQ